MNVARLAFVFALLFVVTVSEGVPGVYNNETVPDPVLRLPLIIAMDVLLLSTWPELNVKGTERLDKSNVALGAMVMELAIEPTVPNENIPPFINVLPV